MIADFAEAILSAISSDIAKEEPTVPVHRNLSQPEATASHV
jgi:hypothetical protein